ncbi:MAG TPA: hypothetical protein VK658_11260, partial [Chryseolinea sp.]|nr:hypothetical protein [Chryseolinea sp.]
AIFSLIDYLERTGAIIKLLRSSICINDPVIANGSIHTSLRAQHAYQAASRRGLYQISNQFNDGAFRG